MNVQNIFNSLNAGKCCTLCPLLFLSFKINFLCKSACWVILHVFFLSSADFFLKKYHKFLSGTLSGCQNSLNSDQAGHFVGPDLGPNCLQRFSIQKVATSRQRV